MVQVIIADVLRHDQLPAAIFHLNGINQIKIVGNLPFAIASPILMTLMRAIYPAPGKRPTIFENIIGQIPQIELLLMFQKEVAEVI
jgi:16S rRNA A1518/A1519 N6-dimethyltransferase RsmA/KsgA/DIM1 with predicted DNA glycosylase/AP lyase activity